VNLFIDSGVGLVLFMVVLALLTLKVNHLVIIARLTMWCRTNFLRLSSACLTNSWNNSITATKYIEYSMHYSFYHMCWSEVSLMLYKRLLTNCLHAKAAELCLANSWNHNVTTTKYIEYINSIPSLCYSFYHAY